MPQTSPYRLTLTDAERTELEARARRYTSPYSEVVRARIVLYAAEGMGNDEIAARLDTPGRWCRNGANDSLTNASPG
jgi:DNA-binding CsgD family transcriptional regulator